MFVDGSQTNHSQQTMFLSETSGLVEQTLRHINRLSKHVHRASKPTYGSDSVSTLTGLLVLPRAGDRTEDTGHRTQDAGRRTQETGHRRQKDTLRECQSTRPRPPASEQNANTHSHLEGGFSVRSDHVAPTANWNPPSSWASLLHFPSHRYHPRCVLVVVETLVDYALL